MKVVIIHGSKAYFSSPKWLSKLSYFVATKIIGTDPSYDYVYSLQRYFEENGIHTSLFLWNGSIFLNNIKKAVPLLIDLIERQNKEVIIVAKSNGGVIAQLAARHSKKITKIIQIGCPNIHHSINLGIPVINIYSKKDHIQKIGVVLNSILNFSIGSVRLKGNDIINVQVDAKHTDLNDCSIFPMYIKYINEYNELSKYI